MLYEIFHAFNQPVESQQEDKEDFVKLHFRPVTAYPIRTVDLKT